MPSRGRRIAARQAQLGQRRRRGRGPSGIPTASALGREAQAEPESATTTTALTETRLSPVPRTESQPMVYRYVGAELRRALILSGVIIAILVALSFLLD